MGDLIRFSRKKLVQALQPAAAVPAGPTSGCFVLDQARIGIHEQDYLDLLPLLRQLHENKAGPLAYRRTVYLFLESGIVAMSHAFYRATVHLFEQPRTLESYRTALRREPRIDMHQHEQLIDRLITEGLLRSVP